MWKSANVAIHTHQRGGSIGPVTSYEWDSYEEVSADLKQIEAHDSTLKAKVRNVPRDWMGGDFDDIIHKSRFGWPALREMLEPMMAQLDIALETMPNLSIMRKRKRKHDDHGDELNMQKVWNGDLDTAWTRTAKFPALQRNQRRVTLFFDVTAYASVHHKDAMWRAALAMKLTEAMLREGRVIEVWVGDTTSGPFTGLGTPRSLITAACVKRSQDPIVMDRLCAMVSLSYLRTASFMLMGAGGHITVPGMGHPANFGLPYSLHQRREAGEAVIHISTCLTKQEALNEYKRAMTDANKPLETV